MAEQQSVTWSRLYLAVRVSTAIHESRLSKQSIADHFTVPVKRITSWETVGDVRENDVHELASLADRPVAWFKEPLSACGDKVHAVRLLLRLSQSDFAKQIGVAPDLINNLERHKTTSVNSSTLQKISELSCIPSSWFLDGQSTPPNVKMIPYQEGLAYQQRKAADLFSRLNSENRSFALKMLEKLSLSQSVSE